MKTHKIYDGRKENFKVHILSATTGSYLYSFGRFWWRKGKKDVKKEMKSCQAYSPMPPHAARGHAPRYEGYHRCKGRGDQVLTCTCHMCTTNELSACFWVNTLMIAMGGNFFLIRVVVQKNLIEFEAETAIFQRISVTIFDGVYADRMLLGTR